MAKPNWQEIRTEWETSKITFKDLADKHNVKLGTLKSRRSREEWSRDATSKKDATQKEKVATREDAPQKKKATSKSNRKGIGNPNPKNQFTKRNSAARKHGLYAKYFNEDQLEIMNDFNDADIADQLWLQIQIKFSAIIQLQKVMWVDYDDSHLKEETGHSSGVAGDSVSYKVAFAYEQYESYIRAQARAMAEYRNLVKQFIELAHDEDERKLKLTMMQTNIDKLKAETKRLENEAGTGDVESIVIVDKWGDINE